MAKAICLECGRIMDLDDNCPFCSTHYFDGVRWRKKGE